MPRLVRELLQDMLDEARFLVDQVTLTSVDDFLANEVSKRAFVRSLEIIGEAAKKVPADVRIQDDSIAWRSICGMRDRLIHDYSGVDYGIVWDAAVNEAPALAKKLERLLEVLPE